ncbi:MAG: hypothetical protein ACE5I7_20930, partial [Candidatus Binatia bacterium]
SRATPGRPSLIGSRLGHAAGILNYAVVGILVCNNTAAMHLLSAGTLQVLFWLVPIYSSVTVAARLGARREPVAVGRWATNRGR